MGGSKTHKIDFRFCFSIITQVEDNSPAPTYVISVLTCDWLHRQANSRTVKSTIMRNPDTVLPTYFPPRRAYTLPSYDPYLPSGRMIPTGTNNTVTALDRKKRWFTFIVKYAHVIGLVIAAIGIVVAVIAVVSSE